MAQSCPTLCDPMDYTAHGILQARILEWVAFPFSRDLPKPGIQPRSPTLQADSLPAEPQGKPKNTGVNGYPIPSPADLLDPRIKSGSPALQADSLPTVLSEKPSLLVGISPKAQGRGGQLQSHTVSCVRPSVQPQHLRVIFGFSLPSLP